MSATARHMRSTILLLLTAGGLVLFLFNTCRVPLAEPDEGRYAEIGREMIASGDWVVPHLFNVPYLEKPPLLYWATALTLKISGLNELGARLTPALAAAAGLLLTGIFAGRLFSARVGVMSIVILSTSLLYFVMARSLLTDMLFSVLITGALMAFHLAQQGRVSERSGYVAFWTFAALATLTKGPAGPVICGAVIFLDLLLGRSLKTVARRSFWTGLPLFLLIAVPWFLLVEQRHPGYLNFYIIKEHLQRASGAEHKEPLFWFVPVLLLGLLPWTFFAGAAVPAWLRSLRSGNGTIRFLLLWCIVVFGLFSAAGGKLIPYILPMFPPLAILIAWYLEQRMSSATAPPRHVKLTAGLTALTLVLLAAGMRIVLSSKASSVRLPLAMQLGLVIPLLFAAVSALTEWGEARVNATGGIALGMTLFCIGLVLAMPTVCDQIMASPHVRHVQSAMQPGDEVALVNVYLPGAAFHLRRIPFVVGDQGELRLGSTMVGDDAPQRFLTAPADLRSHPINARVFLLTRPTTKRGEALNAELRTLEEDVRHEGGSLTTLAENYKSALLLLTRGTKKMR